MGKFEQEAKDLLQAIGGKENVTAVTHCATRMRFVLEMIRRLMLRLSSQFQLLKEPLQMQVNFR